MDFGPAARKPNHVPAIAVAGAAEVQVSAMAKVKLPPAPNGARRRLRFPRLGLVKEHFRSYPNAALASNREAGAGSAA